MLTNLVAARSLPVLSDYKTAKALPQPISTTEHLSYVQPQEYSSIITIVFVTCKIWVSGVYQPIWVCTCHIPRYQGSSFNI
jgi:hypothetical protein